MMPNMQNFYPAWLNPSYYQNIPHNEVNWAQLAQQWMTMRAVEPRFVVPPMQMQQFQLQNQIHHQMTPHSFPPHQQHPHPQSHQQTAPPPLPPMEDLPPPPPSTAGPPTRPTPLFPAFETPPARFQRRFGSNQDFGQFPSPPNVHQGQQGLLPTPTQYRQPPPPPQQQQPPPMDYANFGGPPLPRPNFVVAEQHQHQHQNRPIFTGQQNLPEDNNFDLSGPFANQYQGSFEDDSFFGQDMDYRKWRPPLIGAEGYYHESYTSDSFNNESESEFDPQQRKNLPAWIREGLEKVERERMKQKEKEDRDEFLKRKEEEKMKNLKKRGKSRFDDSESDGEENGSAIERDGDPEPDTTAGSEPEDQDEISSMSAEERRTELMVKLRRWLTEILMEVTGGEIEKVVQQTHKAKLRKAQPKVLAQTSALATITSLGTDYGSDDEDADAASSTTTDDDIINTNGDNTPPPEDHADPFKRPIFPPVFSKKKLTSVVGTLENQPADQERIQEKSIDFLPAKIKNEADSDKRKFESDRHSRKRSRSRSSSPRSSKRSSKSSKRSRSPSNSRDKSSRFHSRDRKSDRRSKDESKKSKKSSRSRSRSRSKGRSSRR